MSRSLLTSLGLCCLAAVLTILPSVSQAGGLLIYCGHWKTQYTDAGIGEDVMIDTGVQARDARASFGSIYEWPSGTRVWHGTLDSNGCTTSIWAKDNQQYKFKMRTLFQDSGMGRRIFIQPQDDTVWQNSYVGYNIYHTTGTLPGYQLTTVNLTHPYHNWQTNLGPIAGRIVSEYSTLQFPASTNVRVRGGVNEGSYYSRSNIGVMIRRYPQDHSQEKFRVAHEFGHMIGHQNADLINAPCDDYYSSNDYCNCDHLAGGDGVGENVHCLQSRETTHDAQSEGWGHFISSAVFNAEMPYSCKFNYYKDVRLESGIDSAPYALDCWQHLKAPDDEATQTDPWMEYHCSGSDKGVEWDWLTFFWNLYANGDDKYTIEEALEVWHEINTPTIDTNWYWDDLVDEVEDIHSGDQDKINQFTSTGEDAGVDW